MNEDKKKIRGFFVRNVESDKETDEIKLPGRNKDMTKNNPNRPMAGKNPRKAIRNPRKRISDVDTEETALDSEHASQWQEGNQDQSSPSEKSLELDEASGTSVAESMDNEPPLKDEKVSKEICEAIKKENSISADAKHIRVKVEHGKAILSGRVPSDQEKMTIGDKAAAFVGFGNVHNRLEVHK
jgi:hypothetical protein